jgi:predicted phosphoribosyltransferase
MIYRDRIHAGQELATHLRQYEGRDDVVVLALPRGGVPVAFAVAQALRAPLDLFLVRKLGVPGHEELAMGAIAAGGVRVLNDEVIKALDIPAEVIERVAAEEQRELERRESAYRGDTLPRELRGKVAIIVDDGLATGSTMRAAIAALHKLEPACIVMAVPVGAVGTCEEFRREADEAVCAATPEPFQAVGLWYDDFGPTSDDEIRDLLQRSEEFNRRGAETQSFGEE